MTLVFMAMPLQPASAAAGLGLFGRLSVHTGGFNSPSTVRSYNMTTGEELLPSFNPVPNPGNGRALAFDRDGNVLTTSLNPTMGDFGGDGKIHKFTRAGGELGFVCVGGPITPPEVDCTLRPKLGALDYDRDENALWGAVYVPSAGATRLFKIDPATGNVLNGCDFPFVPTGGAGNDTIAVAKIGGVKVLLTDAADGNLPSTTLYSIKASACVDGNLVPVGGPDVTSYLLKRGGADVARVTGVAVDPGSGSLLVASIAADEGSTTIYNLGLAPFQNAAGPALDPPVSGLVYDIAIDTSLLDDFDRADGGRYTSNLGPNWSGATGGGFYRIASNQLKNLNSGYITWQGATFGPDQEAAITFKQISQTADQQNLNLKVVGIGPDGNTGGSNFSMVQVQYDATQSQILINSAVPPKPVGSPGYRPQWVTHLVFAATLVNGDTLGARALSDGTVVVLRNGVAIGQTNVTQGPDPFPAALAAGGGKIGLWVTNANFANPSIMDNFRGGTLAP